MTEAAQIDSSKVVKDGAPQADAAAAMSVSDVAGSFKNADRATVLKALDSNPNLYQRVLTMTPEELAQLDEQLKANKTPSPEPAPVQTPASGAAPAVQQPTEPEKELTITLKPSDLGTYLSNGRTAQEAIVELVKGKKNADDRIQFLKNDQIPSLEKQARTLAEANAKLQTDLDQLKKSKPPVETPAPQASADSKATDIVIPNADDFDFYDPDQQKGIFDLLKKAKTKADTLAAEIAALKTAQPAAPAPQPQPAPQARADDPVTSEFEQIRLLQKDPDTGGIFSTNVDVMDVEKQNVAFMEALAQKNGLPGVFDANGQIIPAAATLLNRYYDAASPEGQIIRSTAESSGIKPPEDLPALNKIYAIRNLRLKYKAENPITGKVEPIPYPEAHRMARFMMPELFAQSTSSDPRRSEREAIARGVEHRQQFAPDPKATSSTELAQQANMSLPEFKRLMAKDMKSYTPQEVDTLRTILRTHGKMSEAEINAYFT